MNRKIHNGVGGGKKTVCRRRAVEPHGRPLSIGYPHSTEFSGFRFDGFVPAEEIERSKICRVHYFFDSHFHIFTTNDLERRIQNEVQNAIWALGGVADTDART